MEKWYCIYTKFGEEDRVCKRLNEIPGIEVLNPKMKTRKVIRGKPQEVVENLFPCYFFSRFDLQKYYRTINYTRGVKRIVGNASNTPFSVDDNIIHAIKLRCVDGYVHIQPRRFGSGDLVTVQAGALKGLTGVFLKETKASDRVLILLNAIQYQATLEIEKAYLAAAHAVI